MAGTYTTSKTEQGGFTSYSIAVTTDASGDCTAYTSEKIWGIVLGIAYVKTDFANGVDMVASGETSLTAVWTGTDVNASTVVYPRALEASNSDGSALTTRTLIPLAGERLKLVVSSGGNAKSGTFYVIVKR